MNRPATDTELMDAIRDLEAIEDELAHVGGMEQFRERLSQIRMAVVDSELQRITHELNTNVSEDPVHLGDIVARLQRQTDLSQQEIASIIEKSPSWVAKQIHVRNHAGESDE